jgi:hypothetical protein
MHAHYVFDNYNRKHISNYITTENIYQNILIFEKKQIK